MEERKKIKSIFQRNEHLNVSYEHFEDTNQTSSRQEFFKFVKYNRKISKFIQIRTISYSQVTERNRTSFLSAAKRLRSKHPGTLSTDLFWYEAKKSHEYKIIKHFSNIKTLSLLNHYSSVSVSQSNCKEWLKRAKCLKKLTFFLKANTEDALDQINIGKKFIKLARTFKKGRLHELVLQGKSEELFTTYALHFPKVQILRFEGSSYMEERRGPIKYIKWKFSYQESAENLKNRRGQGEDWDRKDGDVIDYREIRPEDWERAKNKEYYMKTKKDLEATKKHFKLCWKYENYQTTTCAPILLKAITKEWQRFGKVICLPSNFKNLEVKVPCYQSSIYEAQNLTSLSIDFINQPQRILHILQSFPDLQNLVTFAVGCHKNSPVQSCPILYPLLEAPRNLTKLDLNLENCPDAFKYLEDFPKNHCIKEFVLVVPIKEEAHLNILNGIVGHLQHAENLRIWSYDCTVLSANPEFYRLFDKIFALPKLRKLWLSFDWLHTSKADYVDPQDVKLVGYGSLLKNLFTKEIVLEKFRFRFPIKHSSIRKAFLFDVLQAGNNLKELKFSVGEAHYEESEVSKVLTLLKNMKQLEVLRLYDFVIPSNKTMEEFADTITSMRLLKSIRFHSISQDVNLSVFATQIPKILVKPNLKDLNILIPKGSDIEFITETIQKTKTYEENKFRLYLPHIEDFLKGKTFSPSKSSPTGLERIFD